MILGVGRSTTSRNASATLAFHQRRNAIQQDSEESVDRANLLKIDIDCVDGKFRARLHMEVAKSFGVMGPRRDSRPEAINDGVEIGRIFVAEGAPGARRVAKSLEQRKWSLQEIANADEGALDGFVVSALAAEASAVTKKLIPPGEGWVRHDDAMVMNPHAQVYFVQVPTPAFEAGAYLKMNPLTQSLDHAGEPHVPRELRTSCSAASASWVRKGAKLDRAVLLNDITKIARLALKFPLSFVDTPACAYALFQGLRSSEAAQWCAENFHKKLLPMVAEKIHTYEAKELQQLLARTLEALDAELLKSAFAFSGCSAMIALVLGDRFAVAGVGRVRAVLLPQSGAPVQVLSCAGSLEDTAELERVREARAAIRDGLIFSCTSDSFDEAARILGSRSVFEVLQIEPGGPTDEKQVRSAYRRMALKVHPDKQAEGAQLDLYTAAFAHLENAKDAIEAMLAENAESCREVHRILRSEVHTRAGAAALLGVDAAAQLDTGPVSEEADKASKELVRKLERARTMAAPKEWDLAIAVCVEAAATMRRGCTAEALPRYESLLREGLSTTRAMGARDLRWPCPVVEMKPETAFLEVPSSSRCRLALLCGSTVALSDQQLLSSTTQFWKQPKATALRWCMESNDSTATSSAVCVVLEGEKFEERPTKKAKVAVAQGPEGTVRVRHILFRHQQLRQADQMARREGSSKNSQEAEAAALKALEIILKDPNQFLRLCRELSDCQTATQPGLLSGDLGWLARGQQEAAFEEACFGLSPNSVGDIVSSSRGLHLIQRLA